MIIFSVEQANQSPLNNMAANCEAADVLSQNGTYHVMNGRYKGQDELSIMTSQVELAKQLATAYNQECYFERGHYGYWYLIDTKTDAIIDTFKTIKEVDKATALKQDAYTMYKGRYYVASKY